MSGRVEFAGFVENVDEALANLDILVHASISRAIRPGDHRRNGGGDCRGRGGSRWAGGNHRHGVTGLLYPPGDVEALAQCLKLLASDEKKRLSLAAAGRARSRDFAPDASLPVISRSTRESPGPSASRLAR